MSELLNFILDHEEPFKSKSRLASLYSDFSTLRTTNPDGYRANVSAWQAALTHAGRAGLATGSGVLSLRAGDGLATELQTKSWGRPLALDAVVDDALTNKTMIPLREFSEAKTSIYEKRWLQLQLPTPAQIARWGLRQVGFGGGNRLADGEFVILANVEAASKQVMASIAKTATTPTSLIYSLETFTHAFSGIFSDTHPLTATDTRILLTHLCRDRRLAALSTSPSGEITAIKFTTPTSTTPPQPITSHDMTVVTLQTLTLSLTTQITTLNTRIASLTATARAAVSTDRNAALRALRTKKLLEATLAKRSDALAQVEVVVESIDDAAGQVEMVRAMEASSRVLKDLNKQTGGVEKVEEVMEGLRGEMDKVEDVVRVLGEGAVEGVDDGEVDEEMERLETEEEERRVLAEKRLVDAAPAVPIVIGSGDDKRREQDEEKEKEVEKRLSFMSLDPPEEVEAAG